MSLTSFDLDCTRCGACCAPRVDWTTYVHVPPHERRRLPQRFALLVVDDELSTIVDSDSHAAPPPQPHGIHEVPFRRAPGVRCVALEGELGEHVGCAMHRERPTVCRKFRVGSRACLEARAEVLGL
ncbi:MAG TPA: YkgJ family cysteine cluster protein [Polyangiaceae bacterium]|nr:YkgJ family cysteine cluster protein [Polyangiaceae bacterium]